MKFKLMVTVLTVGSLLGCRRCGQETEIDLTAATIVLPDNAKNRENAAANDIAFFFKKMTGGNYRVVEESAAPATGAKIFVGATKQAAARGIAPTGAISQCFRVKTDGGNLYLVGATPTATDFAASWTLGRFFDCYSLDYDNISAPVRKVLKMKAVDRDFTPTVARRDIYTWIRPAWLRSDKKDVKDELTRRNFMKIEPEDATYPGSRGTKCLGGVHNLYDYLPPEKFGKTHPEYYSANKKGAHGPGKGQEGQLCFSNKAMREAVKAKLVEVVKEDMKSPKELWPNAYEFSQRDTCHERLCWCADCENLAEKLGGQNGILIDMMNELAVELKKRLPGAVMRTLAYECTEHPGKVKPADNVLVRYCDYYDKSVDLQPLESSVNRAQYSLFKEWVDSGARLAIWKYILPRYSQPQMSGLGQPGTSIDAIIADTLLYQKVGLNDVFQEMEYEGYLPRTFAFLQYFVLSQLLFDRDQDPERLIDIYMKNVYGVASTEMCAYLQYLRRMQKENPITRVSDWMYRRFPHLTPEFYEKALNLLAAAAKKAEADPVLRAKVAAEYADVLHAYWRFGAKTVALREQAKKDFEREERLHLNALPWSKSIIERNEIPRLEKELKAGKSHSLWIDTVNLRGALPATSDVHGADAWAEVQKLGTWAEAEAQSYENDLFATAAIDRKTGKIGVVLTRKSEDPTFKDDYSVVIMNRTGSMKGATARKLVNGRFAGEFKLVPDVKKGYVYAWMTPNCEIYIEKDN